MMMANTPVTHKAEFASAIGTGKPAAAMDGLGMDFLALLEQAEAMPAAGAPVTGEQPAPEVGLSPISALSASQAPEGKAPLPVAPPAPDLNLPIAGKQAAAHRPASPTLNRTAHAPLVDNAPAEAGGTDEDASAPDDEKASATLTEGLALPLLQNVERIAPAEMGGTNGTIGQAAVETDDPQATAIKAFALPPAALRQAESLPEQAAEPAQRQALERLETFALPKGAALPETAQAPQKAAPGAAVHQKVEAAEAASPIAVPAPIADAAEKPSAVSSRRIAGMPSGEVNASAPAALAAPAMVPLMPVMPVAQPAIADVAAPTMPTPAVDTAAALGEQVIDMGIEGQWIDRVAREIVDMSAGTGRASFTLNPDNLGRLQVEILQRDEGADVRLIAETEDAVNILNQGRHQLQQDSRLQATRINDVQIERSNANSDNAPVTRGGASGQELAQQQSHSQSQAFHKRPLIESVSSRVRGEEPGDSADGATFSRNARYA